MRGILKSREQLLRRGKSDLEEIKRSTQSYGSASPLGASLLSNGVNFSVFSRDAQGVDLLLFESSDAEAPSRVVTLDPIPNRTYHYWHVVVPELTRGQVYAFRVHGQFAPELGMRFNPEKILLDPYGRAVGVPLAYNRETLRKPGDTAACGMKSIVVDVDSYDWEGDSPLHTPCSRTVIYELHVRGFTCHPNSGVPSSRKGTYAGLIEKIPYLQSLGITAVELLPVFQFDTQDCPPGLVNYWGYAPISFFSPHRAYSSRQDPEGPVDEFRDMVKALHRAGIEVILDVVYNHTAEGDQNGPTMSFRGFDNATYYILETNRSRYANYSGCGNTINANHPIVRRMILDSLRYWVKQMHVDGFRFDLASILSRDASGICLTAPPVLWDIETDPELAGTKLIAEAWDAAGLYQVGNFIGDSWQEWNGRFRDDVRSFLRGDQASVRRVADCLLGSPAIYAHEQREAEQSVNFVTCHDGFTLNDLVSYNQKHNDANGENNRDGGNDDRSWNCGVEGPSNDPDVERLRNRQIKNFLTVTLLSVGMPMILMGDEVRRTQNGNNNNYCHDDETSWLDWSLMSAHADIHRFTTLLIKRRLQRNALAGSTRKTLSQLIEQAHKAWHGVSLFQPDWCDWSHSLALSARLIDEPIFVYMILNAFWEPLEFELPFTDSDGNPWRLWIDTGLDPPSDIVDWQLSPTIAERTYQAKSRSVAVLFKGADD